uniref:Uncharacterized protein n=1 Tax=Aliivibrio fischeri TaxID=668 RepID=H2ERS7_ALIFS|nr:hypothetical protein [Aliivibrio fischeri]
MHTGLIAFDVDLLALIVARTGQDTAKRFVAWLSHWGIAKHEHKNQFAK